ncbi:MAG: LPS-assembly protein LptD [Hyphomicrobium sp.]
MALGALVILVAAGSDVALAQDPSLATSGSSNTSAFAKTPGGIFGKTPKLDSTLPLYLQGDELIYDTKGNRVIARGNVEIFYNKNVLTADEVIYDQSANTLTAVGNVELKDQNGNVIRAARYTLTDDFRDGFVQSLSVVARDDSRITAERGERREGNITEFTGATFTACKTVGNTPPLWCVGAKKIIHDQQAGTITYQDAEFKLYGITVAYVPYFESPDPSVKRKSGFLSPSYGSTEDLGFFFEVPYYFALSPNFDFTFHPRYMTEQGILWQGDWRHKVGNGEYSINLAGIDQDSSNLAAGNDDLDGWRGSLETHGKFSLSSWWSYGWNGVIESDETFRRFYKLDSVLLTDRVNDIWLAGLSDRSFFGARLYHFGGLLVNDSDQSESIVHPIIDHNYVFDEPVLGGELTWRSNALSFSRTNVAAAQSQDQSVSRAITELKWRRRLTDTIGITYTPFAELRGDIYQVENYAEQLGAATDDTFARGLATGGATIAYPWVANTGSSSHVIEPIGQIVAHNSSVKQRGLPDEDAKSLIFDDTNLFETTKFSGYDRLETGVRANVGVQYTFQGPVGHARVLAGQSYHIAGTNAYADPGQIDVDGNPATNDSSYVFSPQSGLETARSDYILGVYLAPVDAFRIISQSRFDERDLSLRREDLAAQVVYGPAFAQASYSYTAVIPELGIDVAQQDAVGTLGLRLTDRWTVTGSLRYDIDLGETLTDSVQLSYLDECFMLSATYAETNIVDVTRDIEPDRSIMFRFEMKHLGGFNYATNVVDFTGGEDKSALAATGSN